MKLAEKRGLKIPKLNGYRKDMLLKQANNINEKEKLNSSTISI